MCREGMFKMQLALKYINLVYLNDCVNDTTLCLTALAESTLETSSVKIGPVKTLLAEKSLNFTPPWCILHNLVHPGKNGE